MGTNSKERPGGAAGRSAPANKALKFIGDEEGLAAYLQEIKRSAASSSASTPGTRPPSGS
jgi:hypothetical protein